MYSDINPQDLLYSLKQKYPSLIKIQNYGKSVLSTPLLSASMGWGKVRILVSAAHHANEWLTSFALLSFISELCSAVKNGAAIYGISAAELLEHCSFCFVPEVNPDGTALVTGRLQQKDAISTASDIGLNFPQIPYPDGWKANIRGVDLNLQYPAGWELAKRIKADAGFFAPAPRDYVGPHPLSEPEAQALSALTGYFSPQCIIALHSQGRVIYWKYGDFEPEGSYELGKRLAEASGYDLDSTPWESGNAGYKDWFIKEFDRPGYTIELGFGENPLPESQLPEMSEATEKIIVTAANFF